MHEVVAGAAACGRADPRFVRHADARRHRADDPVRHIDEARLRRRPATRAATPSTACRWTGPAAAGCEMVRVQALYEQLRFLDDATSASRLHHASQAHVRPRPADDCSSYANQMGASGRRWARNQRAPHLFERGVVALVALAQLVAHPTRRQQLGRQQRVGEQDGATRRPTARTRRAARSCRPARAAGGNDRGPAADRVLLSSRPTGPTARQPVRRASPWGSPRIVRHCASTTARSSRARVGQQVVRTQPHALAQLGELQTAHRLAQLGAGARRSPAAVDDRHLPHAVPSAPPGEPARILTGLAGEQRARPGDRRCPRPRAHRPPPSVRSPCGSCPRRCRTAHPSAPAARLDSRGGCMPSNVLAITERAVSGRVVPSGSTPIGDHRRRRAGSLTDSLHVSECCKVPA